MNLSEKIERAKTCAMFNSRLSSSGNCNTGGYAPFDCDRCKSYKKSDLTKNCKSCGCKMVWEHPDIPGHFMASSCDIEDWPICHDCMVEHCCQTNCLGCEYGKYPSCQFNELKKHYMEEDK